MKEQYMKARKFGVMGENWVAGVLRGGWFYEGKFYYMRGLQYSVIDLA